MKGWNGIEDSDIAARAGVSLSAVALMRDLEVIDLHLEPYLPVRLVGYDLKKRHSKGWNRGHLMGHLDFPGIQHGGLSGGMWSITTNIARTGRGKWETFCENVTRLVELIEDTAGSFELVRTVGEYRAARSRGAHAVMVVVQGGNALTDGLTALDTIPAHALTRVTLVHLTNSEVGTTSSPLRWPWGRTGIGPKGREMIEALNHHRVFVDLAHIHRDGFWEALDVQAKGTPVLVTHTGVTGVKSHWRNLDDAQLRAVAETGGTSGIIFAKQFLSRSGGPNDCHMVLEHMEHAIRVCGEEHVSIGSDLDGFITPPPDLMDGDGYLRLVDGMLQRGWEENRIRRVCGENFLRTFEQLRP